MLTAARIALLHHPKPQNRKTAEGEPKSSQNPTAAAQLHQKTNKRSTNSTQEKPATWLPHHLFKA